MITDPGPRYDLTLCCCLPFSCPPGHSVWGIVEKERSIFLHQIAQFQFGELCCCFSGLSRSIGWGKKFPKSLLIRLFSVTQEKLPSKSSWWQRLITVESAVGFLPSWYASRGIWWEMIFYYEIRQIWGHFLNERNTVYLFSPLCSAIDSGGTNVWLVFILYTISHWG